MVGEGDLKLLGEVVSPFMVRMCMALSVKGVSYEYIEQDLFSKSQLLVESNPVHKKVPVLLHDGKPICKSLVIMQYIDEVWGAAGLPSILPVDPYEHVHARFWAAFVDEKFIPAWIGIMQAAMEEERAEKVDVVLAAAGHLEEAFAKFSKGKAFFADDSVGYVNLAVRCNLFWLEALRQMFSMTVIDAGTTPLLAMWAEWFGAMVVAKEAMSAADTTVVFSKKMQARRATAAVAANAK